MASLGWAEGGSSSGPNTLFNQPTLLQRYKHLLEIRYRKLLDDVNPYVAARWVFTGVLALIYVLRVFFLGGWHIISYALGIYILNLLIGFLSPHVDPELDATALPLSTDDEFKPFIRRLPEFKFWYAITRALLVAILCTFVSFLNIPVFWPILLLYFLGLFTVTMKRQIRHMIRYKYVPFTTGKKRYRGKSESDK